MRRSVEGPLDARHMGTKAVSKRLCALHAGVPSSLRAFLAPCHPPAVVIRTSAGDEA